MTLAGAVMLIVATLVIGRPSVFTDTDDYYAQGRSIVRALDKWAFHGVPILNWEDAQYRMTHADGGDEEPVHNQDGGPLCLLRRVALPHPEPGNAVVVRFHPGDHCGGVDLRLLARGGALRRCAWTYLALMGALAAASTLPVFTGFRHAGRVRRFRRAFDHPADDLSRPVQMAGAGDAVVPAGGGDELPHVQPPDLGRADGGEHSSALVWFKAPWSDLLKRGATVLLAAVVAIAASTLYAKVVQLRSGDELGHPPFLTARVLADGPGRNYLQHACKTGAPYVVCGFKWLPLDDSEDILWADEPERGIFNLSEFGVRQKMEHEDVKFALASTLYDPIGQAKVSLDNWRKQIFNIRLDEPLLNPGFLPARSLIGRPPICPS